MTLFLRLTALWTAFNGLVLVAFAATHVDLVRDDVGRPRDIGAAAGVALLLLAIGALGLLALYSSWALWRLRNRGRVLTVTFFSVCLFGLLAGVVFGDAPHSVVPPAVLAAAIALFLMSRPAERACQRTIDVNPPSSGVV